MQPPAFTPAERGIYFELERRGKGPSLSIYLSALSNYRQLFSPPPSVCPHSLSVTTQKTCYSSPPRRHTLSTLTSPHIASPPEIKMMEGMGGFDWLRCWDVILKCVLVCVWVCVCVCVCMRGEGPGQSVMLGLLHRKLICLYFIPHFGSDEPAPHSGCGWPSFTTLCASLSLSLFLPFLSPCLII